MTKQTDRRTLIARELAGLAMRGRLSPKRVVAWARQHRTSTLYRCFQWDDSRAAREYRLWQARELIVSVEVAYPDGRKRQVYVSPLVTRRSGDGYHRLVDVIGDQELRGRFLAQALDELERTCDRYEDLSELAGVRAAVRLVRVGRRKAS